jgi:hypothetical protein
MQRNACSSSSSRERQGPSVMQCSRKMRAMRAHTTADALRIWISSVCVCVCVCVCVLRMWISSMSDVCFLKRPWRSKCVCVCVCARALCFLFFCSLLSLFRSSLVSLLPPLTHTHTTTTTRSLVSDAKGDFESILRLKRVNTQTLAEVRRFLA